MPVLIPKFHKTNKQTFRDIIAQNSNVAQVSKENFNFIKIAFNYFKWKPTQGFFVCA